MQSVTPFAPLATPLRAVTQRAGAVMSSRSGMSVAAHYGSAAAELGVCVRAVGLADRSDLGKLQITGRATALTQLVHTVTGAPLEPTGVATAAAAWWCAASPEQVLVLCEPGRIAPLMSMLRAQSRRYAGVEVADISSARSAIGLVGDRAAQVLSALVALGPGDDPRAAAPFGRAMIGGSAVHILLQTDKRAIVLTEPHAAGRVWRAIARAGQPFGLSYVGTDAVERFALLDRLRVPHAPSR